MGQTVVEVGKSFRGTPYKSKTLEINNEESLVINLRGFDCTTYVENVMAFSLLLQKEVEDFGAFTSILQNIRYRDGELVGYPSRLHYFSEWILNNEIKGLVKNISADLGGIAVKKDFNFMSTHRELYPMLKDSDANLAKIKSAEDHLSQQTWHIVPKDQVRDAENLIRNGDIIAMATSINGLDVTHTGFALKKKDGRIHLLHASTSGQVEISKKPLADYLKGINKNIGILVARPQ